jgi:hypothetical protein
MLESALRQMPTKAESIIVIAVPKDKNIAGKGNWVASTISDPVEQLRVLHETYAGWADKIRTDILDADAVVMMKIAAAAREAEQPKAKATARKAGR